MKQQHAATIAAQPASTHRSLERGLAVIELLAAAGTPLHLAEAARRLGLHRSTAHHLMRTLVALGWLHQDAETRLYGLSARPYQLTGRKWSVAQIGELAQPLLEKLTQDTGEGTSVAAWADGIVTIAAKREHDGPVRVVQDLGGQRPMYCTAVGKAIAGWLPPAEVPGYSVTNELAIVPMGASGVYATAILTTGGADWARQNRAVEATSCAIYHAVRRDVADPIAACVFP